MTYTPGPWTTDLDKIANDYEPEHIRVYSEGITRGGVNFRPEIAHVYFNNADNERQANAKLIAAAPDLLAALKDMRAQLREHIRMDVKKHYSLMVADAAAGTAIDKATK